MGAAATDQLRIPKQRLHAIVRMIRETPEDLVLFIAEQTSDDPGPGRPSDLLNGELEFIPAETAWGEIVFLRRDQLVVVDVWGDDVGCGACNLADGHQQVVMWLDDGETIEGNACDALPAPRSRVQDWLNRRDTFLRVHRHDRILLVNKTRIVKVAER